MQTNGSAAPQQAKPMALATRDTAPIEMRTDRAAFEPGSLPEALTLAANLVKSGLMPAALRSPEAVVTAIVMGRELGLTAMQSVRSIHVIEGKPALSSALIVALCKKSPLCRYFQLLESTDEIATYETHREGEPKATKMSFTMAQAIKAGVANKNTWKNYPAAMLRARCETALARSVYPDLVMGLYDPDELESQRSEPRPERDVTPVREATPPAARVSPAPTIEAEASRAELTPAPIVAVAVEPVPPSAVALELIARAEAAASGEELDSVAKDTNAAKKRGELTDTDREAVKVAVQSRRKALTPVAE